MPAEDNLHVPLGALWRYRAENIPLSNDEFQHVYACSDCLADLRMCQLSETMDQVQRLKQDKLKPSDA